MESIQVARNQLNQGFLKVSETVMGEPTTSLPAGEHCQQLNHCDAHLPFGAFKLVDYRFLLIVDVR